MQCRFGMVALLLSRLNSLRESKKELAVLFLAQHTPRTLRLWLPPDSSPLRRDATTCVLNLQTNASLQIDMQIYFLSTTDLIPCALGRLIHTAFLDIEPIGMEIAPSLISPRSWMIINLRWCASDYLLEIIDSFCSWYWGRVRVLVSECVFPAYL